MPRNSSLLLLSALAVAFLTHCSHGTSHLRTEVYPATVDPKYVTEKERELERLDSRVAELEKLSKMPSRKYEGSHAKLETLASDQRKKLLSVQGEFNSLKKEKEVPPEATAKLNEHLDEIRTTLNTAVTE